MARRAEIARRKARLLLEENGSQAGRDDENEEEPWDYGEGTSAQGALGQWATAHEPAPAPAPAPVQPEPACRANERLPNGSILEHFPIAEAGSPISDEQTPEMDPETYLASCGSLGDPDAFEIAELLMTTGLSNKGRNRLLKSKLYKGKTPWKNCQQMLGNVDKLPKGPEWKIRTVVTPCDGHEHTNYVFARDIIAVIRELIGNRRFKRIMRYAPVKHWRIDGRGKKSRVYGEMWTAEWWWETQWILSRVNARATVVPLIIASDKTSLSTLSGGQEAYPVYLTIGNISKTTRRKAKEHATVLIGYLPVDKFEDVKTPEVRARLRADMTHRAMEKLTAPLKTASEHGFKAWCADGRLRHVYRIMAAFVGDWPEQNMMACTNTSGCPICEAPREGRGNIDQVSPP
ncbi:hypothetical protein FRC12_022990 [Ceratobasidium sp. 428]|nr:hypothetical protein FRC12_022990 [Ceratobasidium sp. 428]